MRILALLALLVLAPAAAAQAIPETRILRVVPNADLQTLDPINTTAGVVQSHAHMVYDQLLGRDADQRPQPQMVARWTTSDDGLTWRFTLRADQTFHDGAPVTAADAVASLRRWAARDPHGRQLLGITESLAADDAESFTWRLRVPANAGRNLARARALIAASGYDGRPLVLMDPTDNPFLHAATLVLASQLQQAGMTVDVLAMDFATMATRRAIRRPPGEGGMPGIIVMWNIEKRAR